MKFYRSIVLIFLTTSVYFTWSTDTSETENDLKKSVIPKAITTFGSNLLRTLCKPAESEENVLISPLNIYTALALTELGAAGLTRSALQRQIFPLSVSDAKTDVNDTSAHQALSEIVAKIEAKISEHATFTETVFANGLFVQNGLQIRETYERNAKKYYHCEPTNVNFAEQPQQALNTINKWVSEKTKERIPKLFESALESTTKVVLASAVYFNGRWKEPFYPTKTKKAKFTLEDKKEIEVDLMNHVERVPYVKDDSLQYEAIRLPYERAEYEMIVVLPVAGQTLKNLTEQLNSDDYKKLFRDEGAEGFETGVDYKIPRMKFKWSRSIKDALVELGFKALFEKADLSNLVNVVASAGDDLQVSDVTHATEIEVDEKGTKASAVTGIKVIGYLAPQIPRTPKPFVADKPFLMMIYNRPTSTLLFYAYVNNPVSNAAK